MISWWKKRKEKRALLTLTHAWNYLNWHWIDLHFRSVKTKDVNDAMNIIADAYHRRKNA